MAPSPFNSPFALPAFSYGSSSQTNSLPLTFPPFSETHTRDYRAHPIVGISSEDSLALSRYVRVYNVLFPYTARLTFTFFFPYLVLSLCMNIPMIAENVPLNRVIFAGSVRIPAETEEKFFFFFFFFFFSLLICCTVLE